MQPFEKRFRFFYFLGDFLALLLALFLALWWRHASLPSQEYFLLHLWLFLPIFLIFIVGFFVAGLYDPHILRLRSRVPETILNTELIIAAAGVAFFYLLPEGVLSPKTVFILFLIISFGLVSFWRLKLVFIFTPLRRTKTIIIGEGEDCALLAEELSDKSRYGLEIVKVISPSSLTEKNVKEEVLDVVKSAGIKLILADLYHPALMPHLPRLYGLLIEGARFENLQSIFESVFGRVPISLLNYGRLYETFTARASAFYGFAKYSTDFLIAFLLLIPFLVFWPIISLLVLFSSPGSIFYQEIRVGRHGRPFKIFKFRTMTENHDRGARRVTKIGRFLRRSRLDELPQIFNVLKGELSLIGPRPEIPELSIVYDVSVPFYSARHAVTPGLSGWAQVYHENHPHHQADIKETAVKLSYDLYYIKNRSIFLDCLILIKTVKILLSRAGA